MNLKEFTDSGKSRKKAVKEKDTGTSFENRTTSSKTMAKTISLRAKHGISMNDS
jgi:hypothetical protein